MVADAAFAFPAPLPAQPARRPTPDDAVVPLEPAAGGEHHHAVFAALARDDVFVDVAAATPAQRRLARRLLPAERIVVGAPPGPRRARATSLLAQQFPRDGRAQAAAHQRLRAQLLHLVTSPWPAPALPRPRDAGLLALVLVRRDHPRAPHAMTPENLRRVLGSLACVAARAPARHERITHALLCGELFPGEVGALAREFAGRLYVDCLSERSGDGEAALLAGLAHLQERYRDALFATGFHSAALDAAALLGIPSFYFDATTSAHGHACYADGRYLVDARRDADLDEPGLILPRTINTFIRVDTHRGPAAPDRDRPPPLGARALADLMTALRVWSARGLPGAHRNGSERVALCRAGLALVCFRAVRAQCDADARRLE